MNISWPGAMDMATIGEGLKAIEALMANLSEWPDQEAVYLPGNLRQMRAIQNIGDDHATLEDLIHVAALIRLTFERMGEQAIGHLRDPDGICYSPTP